MAESSKPTSAIEVFFSYSHKDEDLRDELSKHLAMLKRKHVITDWHDRRIGAGKEWEQEIDERLNTADIILLLISSDFLASDYCYDIEVKTAMRRHDDGEARVIPVILRPVDWKGAPFGKLQSLPKDARPVTDWPNRDEAFRNVAQGIRVEAEELAVNQIKRLFSSLWTVERLKNWPNVISLGERILKSLPDHLPEYRDVCARTAAAYVKRWTRYLDDSPDIWGPGGIRIKKKRHEDEEQIRVKIMADLNRAIELDPEIGEYYYLRWCMRRPEYDYESVELDYTREYERAQKSDHDRASELDPSIAEVLRERQRARDALREEPETLSVSPTFSWEEFLANPPKPMKIKEPWRLKCLRD